MKTTKTFKSGNSVAVRLPKVLGVAPGIEMTVREDRGRYIVEPAEEGGARQKIDLSAVYGSIADLQPIEREDKDYEDIPREWHLLGLKPR
jgi:antitoxin VapB